VQSVLDQILTFLKALGVNGCHAVYNGQVQNKKTAKDFFLETIKKADRKDGQSWERLSPDGRRPFMRLAAYQKFDSFTFKRWAKETTSTSFRASRKQTQPQVVVCSMETAEMLLKTGAFKPDIVKIDEASIGRELPSPVASDYTMLSIIRMAAERGIQLVKASATMCGQEYMFNAMMAGYTDRLHQNIVKAKKVLDQDDDWTHEEILTKVFTDFNRKMRNVESVDIERHAASLYLFHNGTPIFPVDESGIPQDPDKRRLLPVSLLASCLESVAEKDVLDSVCDSVLTSCNEGTRTVSTILMDVISSLQSDGSDMNFWSKFVGLLAQRAADETIPDYDLDSAMADCMAQAKQGRNVGIIGATDTDAENVFDHMVNMLGLNRLKENPFT
ncbi:unnamed protein product, partial [marine sediment metagenome]